MPDPNESAVSSSSSSPGAGIPQFSTAEYARVPGTERCQLCNSLLPGAYYRVNNQMACETCASQAKVGQPRDSHVAFTRALIFGIGAAIVGMIAYATFTIVTGWYIGYLALGVGYLVAIAMKKGSHQLGGRRYQIAAVLLTYAAISLAAVPIALSSQFKQERAAKQPQQESQATHSDSAENDEPQPAKKSVGTMIVTLVFIGLASPFMELQDPLHGAIGLLILFIGLRIAWRMTASTPLTVEGPYSQAAPA